jgi:2-methylcitrate dehydratase
MNSPRDLGWRNIEALYKSSAAYQFARYALGLKYDLLPPDVIHQAKRSLLDAMGCAIGAYDAPGRPICESVARELGGPEESTVFCSGLCTSAPNATLVNSFLVRFLDANDIGGGGHNSDSIPAILAVCERENTGGKELLTSLVISYELGARVIEAAGGKGNIEEKGFTPDVRGGLSMPPALGKIMAMNEEQIANAIGICASGGLSLNVVDADEEENFMKKNLRFGWVAHDAILSCLLAQKGFTGPVNIIEGDSGWNVSMFDGEMKTGRLVDFSGWRILDTRHKSICANGSSHGYLQAVLAIVQERHLKPGDIAAVRITASPKEVRHTTTFTKKYPRTAENADHSAFYLTAFAIKEGKVGPESGHPENFTDPVILDLIEKIQVEAFTRGPDISFEGAAEITTKDGRNFEKHVACAHGFGNDPLTDLELEYKFQEFAGKYISENQIRQIIETVWNIEKLDDIRNLTRLMVFQPK